MSDFNIPAWLSALVASVALVWTIANTLHLRRTGDKSETETKLVAQSSRIGMVENDVAEIRGELKNIPSTEDLHKLALKMTEMNAQIGPMGKQLSRIEEFLLNAKQPSARRTK